MFLRYRFVNSSELISIFDFLLVLVVSPHAALKRATFASVVLNYKHLLLLVIKCGLQFRHKTWPRVLLLTSPDLKTGDIHTPTSAYYRQTYSMRHVDVD